MSCPYLKEVVMLYCDACLVKKMVPLDRLVSTNPCIAHDFKGCPLFRCAGEPAESAPRGKPEARREVTR